MAKQKGHEVIPSARRLITSLRDMGYDFVQAVADLVDNSVEAGATHVDIVVEYDGADSSVRIADNGKGMPASELKEAMRYGAEREYCEEDLGKFGLGLKTASFSQCRKLIVASRGNRNRRDISAFCWDLDYVEKANRWEILEISPTKLGPEIRYPLQASTGTVVVWRQLDRMVGFGNPDGKWAQNRMLRMCRELEEHLAMVFHRFLGNQMRKNPFRIILNGNEIHAWDPFASAEPNCQRLTAVRLPLNHNSVKGEVVIEPFVLPRQDLFSSPDAHARSSGPEKWNRQQGFYIYRAGRMIQSGGWCHLRTIDEHTKLARVALSFSPTLDEAFRVNVAKMRVQLPPELRDKIDKAVQPAIKLARETYDKAPVTAAGHKTNALIANADSGATSLQPIQLRTTVAASPSLDGDTDRLWTLDEIQTQLDAAAQPEERPILAKVFDRLRGRLSTIRAPIL